MGKFILVTFGILNGLLRAFALSIMIGWFTPFHVTWLQTYGLLLIVRMFGSPRKPTDEKRLTFNQALVWQAGITMSIWVAFGVAWVTSCLI
jgi:hypothetical protein